MTLGENDPVAPELFVPNVKDAIRFYTQTFGFTVQRREPANSDQSSFAIMRLGEAMIMLMDEAFYSGPRSDLTYRGAGLDIRIMVDDVEAKYSQAKAAGLSDHARHRQPRV